MNAARAVDAPSIPTAAPGQHRQSLPRARRGGLDVGTGLSVGMSGAGFAVKRRPRCRRVCDEAEASIMPDKTMQSLPDGVGSDRTSRTVGLAGWRAGPGSAARELQGC